MKQWNEFERNQTALLRDKAKTIIKCAKCTSEWMEVIAASRYDADQIGVLGQKPSDTGVFYVLKCVRCGELHEPPITRAFNHPDGKYYDSFLDTLQEPEEKWSGKEPDVPVQDKE